jgi:UDP-glucose 4-epimerase
MTVYLVTGGAGFIGSNIVEELVRRGERVRILDNFSTGKRENIALFLEDIELIEGDLRHLDTVRQVMEGVDYVLHQGAIPSVPRSINNPLDTDESNVRGTLNLLVAARDAGVKNVVCASSSAVYGEPSPLSPYAVSKLAGEHYCQVFYQVYRLETVALRYFNVFGPRQDPTSEYAAVVPKFVAAMLRGEQPVIYGDGEQSRDFSWVDRCLTLPAARDITCWTWWLPSIAFWARTSPRSTPRPG